MDTKRALTLFGTVAAFAALGAAGCSVEADTEEALEAPSVDIDGLEERQTVSNAGWTMTSSALADEGRLLYGWTTFTGSGTRNAGTCTLRVYYPSHACTGTSQGYPSGSECNSYPTSLPSGGSRYCLAINGTGTRYCMYRPGPASAYCLGSPVTGQPISPTTLSKEYSGLPVGSGWVQYSCFEGCSSVPGSVSTGATIF